MSRQLDVIFVAPKLHQVSNMFETPAISRRQIALKSHLVCTWDFEVATLSATKIASSCRDKNRLCKRALVGEIYDLVCHILKSEDLAIVKRASDVISQTNSTNKMECWRKICSFSVQACKQVFLKQFSKRTFGVHFTPISLRACLCCLTLTAFQ